MSVELTERLASIDVPTRPNAVVFDIDGTLADVSHIVEAIGYPFTPTPENLKKFHSMSRYAPPNQWVVDHAHEVWRNGIGLVIVTARGEEYKDPTLDWLAAQGIRYDDIHMRPAGDQRPDHEVKKDILDVLESEWVITHAYDDNPEIVALWQRHGIPVTVVPGWPE